MDDRVSGSRGTTRGDKHEVVARGHVCAKVLGVAGVARVNELCEACKRR